MAFPVGIAYAIKWNLFLGYSHWQNYPSFSYQTFWIWTGSEILHSSTNRMRNGKKNNHGKNKDKCKLETMIPSLKCPNQYDNTRPLIMRSISFCRHFCLFHSRSHCTENQQSNEPLSCERTNERTRQTDGHRGWFRTLWRKSDRERFD